MKRITEVSRQEINEAIAANKADGYAFTGDSLLGFAARGSLFASG